MNKWKTLIKLAALSLLVATSCFGQQQPFPGGGGGGAGFAGVNSQTANYTAVSGDNGKLISFNGSNLTLTLPNPAVSLWSVTVQNLNSTNLTVSRNGLLINGTASNLTVVQNATIGIATDGTNYFTIENPAGITADGGLAYGPSGNLLVGSLTITGCLQIRDPSGGAPASCSFAGIEFPNSNAGRGITWNDNGGLASIVVNSDERMLFSSRNNNSGGIRTVDYISVGNPAQNVTGCSLTSAVGGPSAGKFNSGTSGTCTITITMAATQAAPNGWTCDAHDQTTAADANNVVQTAFTTTTITMSGTTVSGDVIVWKCMGW